MLQRQTVDAIVKCNDFTIRHGLILTPQQALELVETRAVALSENGRVEFGTGILDKIIREFCDSPYITMQNYMETLHELIEMFYYFKNETQDSISDDELIAFMSRSFDNVCHGSLELLSGRELPELAGNLRAGIDPRSIELIYPKDVDPDIAPNTEDENE
jgi:hypothetical protein